MNQVKLASNKAIKVSGDLATASSEANKASPKLVLASDEVTLAAHGHHAMLSEVAHKGAAKAHFSGEDTSQAFTRIKCYLAALK